MERKCNDIMTLYNCMTNIVLKRDPFMFKSYINTRLRDNNDI